MRATTLSLLALAALGLGGCGSSGSSDGASSSTPSKPASSSPAQAVTATESEYKIHPSVATLKAGRVTIKVVNAGKYPHNLVVEGPGVSGTTTPNISGGAQGSLAVDLRPGTYQLYCSIPGHRAQGMEATLKVT